MMVSCSHMRLMNFDRLKKTLNGVLFVRQLLFRDGVDRAIHVAFYGCQK